MEITQDYLKEIFNYDHETGDLTRKNNAANKKYKSGDIVGWINGSGYREVEIKGKSYKVHRIIYMMNYGYWPDVVDHIDRNRLNNKLENVADTNKSGNAKNCAKSKNNTSGATGVGWHKGKGKWQAYIRSEGDQIYLGSFDSIDDAIRARKEAELKYKFNQKHGK